MPQPPSFSVKRCTVAPLRHFRVGDSDGDQNQADATNEQHQSSHVKLPKHVKRLFLQRSCRDDWSRLLDLLGGGGGASSASGRTLCARDPTVRMTMTGRNDDLTHTLYLTKEKRTHSVRRGPVSGSRTCQLPSASSFCPKRGTNQPTSSGVEGRIFTK